MIEIAVIAACALINVLRGQGFLPRIASSSMTGTVMGLYALSLGLSTLDIGIASTITTLGVLVWRTPGWGKYFSAIHGRDSELEREIAWIDKAGYWLIPPRRFTAMANRLRGTFQMALRGLFLYPTFACMAFFFDHSALLLGLLSCLQGPIYFLAGRIVREERAVALAEVIMGAMIGALLVASL